MDINSLTKEEIIARCNSIDRKTALETIANADNLSGSAEYCSGDNEFCAVGILLNKVGLLDGNEEAISFPGVDDGHDYGITVAMDQLGVDGLFGLTCNELDKLQRIHDEAGPNQVKFEAVMMLEK